MNQLIQTIDDSIVVRKIMEASLRRAGFRSVTFGDGQQAIRALTNGDLPIPAAIFVDVCLPTVDGYAVVRAIKRLPRLGHPLIILLSGRDGVIDKVRGRLVGANVYLTKPFNPTELIALLQRHLTRATGDTGPVGGRAEEYRYV